MKILPGLVTVMGSTKAEAGARYEDWAKRAPNRFSAERLVGMLGIDLGSSDPDAPIPESLLLSPVDSSFGGSLDSVRPYCDLC